MTSNDQQIDLVINRLKRAQYEDLCQQGKIDETQLYMITDDPNVSCVVSSYLSDYYPKSETSSATEIQNAFDNIPKPDMSEYYKKTETSSAVEISSILNDFAKISVDNELTQDLHLRHISYDEYSKLVADEQVDHHTLYILSAEGQDDQFGDRIVNVGAPISADDAATKDYVDNEIAKIPVPDLSEYYKKSETSSSIELVNEFSQKASQQQVDGIEEKIPEAASSENQLADKSFVNSSINNYAAFYLTKNVNGDAFGTYAELSSATKFYNAGVEKTPSKNDYLVVLEDETKTTALSVDPTTRYTYQGEWPTGQFEFQYIVNNTALTQAQVDAINSGITKDLVDQIKNLATTLHGI